MGKRLTSPQDLNIVVELKNGDVLKFEKNTKWTLDRVMSHYTKKYYNEWQSVEVKVAK